MVGEKKVNFKGMVLLAPSVDDDAYKRIMTDLDGWNAAYAQAEAEGHYVRTSPWGQVQDLSKQWFDEIKDSKPLANADKYKGKTLVIYAEDDTSVAPETSLLAVKAFNADVALATGAGHSYSFYSDITEIKDVIEVNTVNTFLEAFK